MVTWGSFLAYTLLVAAIAYWFTRRETLTTADGYFLAGRSLGGWVIAGSLVLTNLSTEHLIGLNADAYRHTVAVMAWETTSALAMVLAALYFLPMYLRRGLTTIPQFLSERFDPLTQLLASLLFLLSYALAILPIVLLFGASGLESLFNLSESWNIDREQATWILVWGVGVLGSLYAVLGGLRAVAISDTINAVGFLIAGLLIPFLALRGIGEGDAVAGMTEVFQENHDKFDITGNEPGSFLPFSVLFTGMIVNQVFFWCTNQSIVQRTLGARSLAEGQKGVLIAAWFKLLGPVVIVLPGVIAFHLFHSELGDDGAMLAYPRLVKHVLPPALTGFFAAVMVGAILSTFNSVLNSAATLFSEGVYRQFLHPGASDRQTVRAGVASSIALAVFAMAIAPTIDTEGSLYHHLQQINATFFGPMLAVILLGMLTKWATPLAAKVALVVGPIVFYLVAFALGPQVQALLRRVLGLDEDVHFLHLLAGVFLFSVGLMAALSLLGTNRARATDQKPVTDQKPAIDQKDEGRFVDMKPWRLAWPMSGMLVVATVGCYWWLAM